MATALPYSEQFLKYKIVLASSSPRRVDLVNSLGLLPGTFHVVPSNFVENLPKGEFASPEEYAIATARGKALDVAGRLFWDGEDPAAEIVIGCDTVVVLDGQIIEKPRDEDHAVDMLKSLSGREHAVYSGVVMYAKSGFPPKSSGGEASPVATASFYERTVVEFGCLNEEDILAYVRTGECLDKAGGYGIQGIGGQFVKRIDGCFSNVIGLPLHKLSKALSDLHTDGKI